jgi:hypothetical protein
VNLFDQFCQSMSAVDVTSTGLERGRCHIDRGDSGDRGARDDSGARDDRGAAGEETADA